MLRLQWRYHDSRAKRREHSDHAVTENRDTRNPAGATVYPSRGAIHSAGSATSVAHS